VSEIKSYNQPFDYYYYMQQDAKYGLAYQLISNILSQHYYKQMMIKNLAPPILTLTKDECMKNLIYNLLEFESAID
jgi:hypothetical protein